MAVRNSEAGTSFVVNMLLVVGNLVEEAPGIGKKHCTAIAVVTSWESYGNWLGHGADFRVGGASCCAELTCYS